MADVVTYNTIIKKLLRCGELDKARGVIEAMRAAGGSLLPNAVTFNEFIDAVIRDNTVAAWQLVDEMKACGLKPTGITASILLKSVQKNCKDGELERCMEVADALKDEMDEVLLSSLCEACIRADRADLLRKPLRRHRSGKTAPITGAITFGSLIRAYGFVQDIEGARRVWREMRQLKIVPTSITIGCMVEALASNGDIEGGHQLIRELLTDPETRSLVNSVMYGSLLKGFSQQKYFSRVWELYAEMVSENLEFTLVTYNVLINVCVRSGDSTRIPGLLEDMARHGIEPSIITYSTVLKAYCYENCMDKAFEMFDELKRSRQYTPDEIIYNTMLDGCARSCLYERGITVLKDMEKRRVRPSAFTLSLLVKLAHRCDRVDKAFELCSEISRKYRIQQNVHVYNNLIAACTSSGNTQWAFDVLQEMLHAKVKPDVRTYTLLLRGCLYNYEVQDAAGLVRAASGLRGAHPRTAGCSPTVYRLPGGLPGELLSEVLQRIAGHGGDEVLAVQLLRELKGMPGATVDPGLPYWMTSKVLKGA
uniref:Pentacotripeptide-repeat region of PRORP domain-containing protein n=1 Tax=Alexandrium catenella TaxID=2925 RepID=A0A7S1SFT1_ALECA